MARRSIQVELESDDSVALIVLGRTSSAKRVVSIEPPARELRELDGILLVRWAAPPGGAARVDLEYWGVPLLIALIETYPAATFDKLDRDALPKRTDPEELRKWRRRAASAIPDHQKARGFFNDLDEGTFVFHTPREDLKALLQALFDERLAGHDDPTALCIPSPYLRAAIEETAQQFTDLFDRAFSGPEELEDAFDLFARGELSMLEHPWPSNTVLEKDAGQACQPDSILVFLFAEFAQLCVAQGVTTTGKFASPGVWGDLLPTLIHAHRCFCEAYGRLGVFEYSAETTGIQRRRRALGNVRAERTRALPAIRANRMLAWRSQARRDVIRAGP